MSKLSGKRVLVVEDEALIAAMVEDMLASLGAVTVGPAGTLEKAIALATSAELDAAIVDLNLRSERSDPVAEILRQRNIPVLFATGYGASAVAGGERVLEKPYTMDKLSAALTTTFEDH